MSHEIKEKKNSNTTYISMTLQLKVDEYWCAIWSYVVRQDSNQEIDLYPWLVDRSSPHYPGRWAVVKPWTRTNRYSSGCGWTATFSNRTSLLSLRVSVWFVTTGTGDATRRSKPTLSWWPLKGPRGTRAMCSLASYIHHSHRLPTPKLIGFILRI